MPVNKVKEAVSYEASLLVVQQFPKIFMPFRVFSPYDQACLTDNLSGTRGKYLLVTISCTRCLC